MLLVGKREGEKLTTISVHLQRGHHQVSQEAGEGGHEGEKG